MPKQQAFIDGKLTLTLRYALSLGNTTFYIKERFLFSTILVINYLKCTEINVFLPGLLFPFLFPGSLYSKAEDL